MAIEQTDSNTVALFDSVTGIAFGPVFTGTDSASPQDEADAFLRWYAGRKCPDCGHGDHGQHAICVECVPDAEGFTCGKAFRVLDLRELNALELRDLTERWHRHLEKHTEDVCPFDRDRDSYGIGYTGDSDHSYGDYTEAVPDPCGCECHDDEKRQVPNGQKRRY
jgi:hypothetical protein